jgi:hypothetical protein
MRGVFRWLRSNALKVMTFATMTGSVTTAVFVWYLWTMFDIKSQALARAGSESAEYMRIATTVLGTWILPALVGVSALALVTFAASLRRGRAVPV